MDLVSVSIRWSCVSVRGLKDKTCWFCRNFSACWCGKVGIEVGGSQLEGWAKRVGFVATFRLADAGKSTLKTIVSSWGYEYPSIPGVRANDDQVWALRFRGAVRRGVLAACALRRAGGPSDSHIIPMICVWARHLACEPDDMRVGSAAYVHIERFTCV